MRRVRARLSAASSPRPRLLLHGHTSAAHSMAVTRPRAWGRVSAFSDRLLCWFPRGAPLRGWGAGGGLPFGFGKACGGGTFHRRAFGRAGLGGGRDLLGVQKQGGPSHGAGRMQAPQSPPVKSPWRTRVRTWTGGAERAFPACVISSHFLAQIRALVLGRLYSKHLLI